MSNSMTELSARFKRLSAASIRTGDLMREFGRVAHKAMPSDLKKNKPYIRWIRKTGRNEFCTCGSGIKFKRCHGG